MMKKMVFTFLATALLLGTVSGSDKNGTFVKQFQDVSRLEMDTVLVPSNITGVSGKTLKVEAFDIPREIRVEITQSGGTVKVKVEKDLLYNPWGFKGRLVVTVPESADCAFVSASGSWNIRGLDGEVLTVNTASGSVECADIGNPLDISTASGSVNVTGSNTGKVIKTASGSILVEKSDGNAILSAISGSVKLDAVKGIVRVNTTSGSIQLNGFRGKLKAESVSGSVKGRAVYLDGDSAFNSTSGSVDLDLDNGRQDFSVSVSTVSGGVRRFDSRSDGSFRDGSGRTKIDIGTISGSVRVY